MLVGLPTPGAGLAFAAFLFAHALYKAPLFFVAGNVDHATGTRVIDHLMGLRRRMPWTTAAAVLAGISMAGLPLSFGFVAKDAITAAKAAAELLAVVGYASIFVNSIAVAVAAVATVRVFGGPFERALGEVHEVGWSMRLPPLVVAGVGLLFGLLPGTVDPLLGHSTQALATDTLRRAVTDTLRPARADTLQPAKVDTLQPARADTLQPARADTLQPTRVDTVLRALPDTTRPPQQPPVDTAARRLLADTAGARPSAVPTARDGASS